MMTQLRSLRLFALVSFMTLSFWSCTKDRTQENGNNQNQPSGLAADLNGTFEVQWIDFGGTVTSQMFSAPIDSAGNGTEGGTFIFNNQENTAQYDVTGRIQTNVLGQAVTMPVPVQGDGDLIIESDTRFIIDDPEQGKTTFDVSNNTGDAMVISTRAQVDTTIFALQMTLDMTMDIKIKRK